MYALFGCKLLVLSSVVLSKITLLTICIQKYCLYLFTYMTEALSFACWNIGCHIPVFCILSSASIFLQPSTCVLLHVCPHLLLQISLFQTVSFGRPLPLQPCDILYALSSVQFLPAVSVCVCVCVCFGGCV